MLVTGPRIDYRVYVCMYGWPMNVPRAVHGDEPSVAVVLLLFVGE